MWGFCRRTRVHQSARMVIDDNWSAKLQMSALVALSTWSGFRATSFCPLTSLHNATWAHCQQMCKRCARQGLESSVSGQFLQKYVAYFVSDVPWTRGFCQWYARFYHTSFHIYIQHLYCTRCVAGHRCERFEWAHGEAWIQTSINTNDPKSKRCDWKMFTRSPLIKR